MARVRSPAYPNASLPDVIDFARRIYDHERRNPVSRDVAVTHMGFSGPTGTSDRAISALFHFGLAEKVAKGELRVTDLAIMLMHPDTVQEKRKGLREAAFSPELFKELRERYPGEPPSAASLGSYLSRQGFAGAAIGPASKAYLETCYFLQREGAYESESGRDDNGPESAPTQSREDAPMGQTVSPAVVGAAPPPPPPMLAENELNLTIRGSYVQIEGRLDLEGLDDLEGKIKALRMLMQPSKKGGMNSARPVASGNEAES